MTEDPRVEGKASSVDTVKETALSRRDAAASLERTAPATGSMLAEAVNNAREVFGFKEEYVHLGREGAYVVHDNVAPFGQGALQIGRLAGVYIHTPEDLIGEDGERHKNPYIVRNADGVIQEAMYRKVVIHMNPAGHVKFKDFIFSRSITVDLARRAMKLMRNGNVPINAKRFANRVMVDRWNEDSEMSGEPGAPIWLYYELPNNPMGVAINANDPHEEVLKFIESNVEVENYFKSATETKAERRAIWYVIPESFKPIMDEGYAPEIVKEGDNFFVDSAWFRVMAPTRAGVLLVLLQKLLIAMLGEDDEAVLRAKEAFAATLGTTVDKINIAEVHEDQIDPITDPDRMEAAKWEHDQARAGDTSVTTSPEIDAVPGTIKSIEEFQAYVSAQIPKLTDEEIEYLKINGAKYVAKKFCDDNELLIVEKLPDAINNTNAPKFAAAFRNIIKKRAEKPATEQEQETAPDTRPDGLTAKAARKFIVEELTEGNVARMNSVIEKHGIDEGVDVSDFPDDKALAIYDDFNAMEEAPGTDKNGQGKLL